MAGHFLAARARLISFFCEHDVVRGTGIAAEVVFAEGFEFDGELLIGQDLRVLQFAQTLVGKETQIPVRDDGLKGCLAGIRDRAMLTRRDTEQVIETVVGRNAVEVMDLMTGRDGFAGPREIDSMGDEDADIESKSMNKFQIPLFAISIRFVFVILVRSIIAMH